jgi:hypothetical protein
MGDQFEGRFLRHGNSSKHSNVKIKRIDDKLRLYRGISPELELILSKIILLSFPDSCF